MAMVVSLDPIQILISIESKVYTADRAIINIHHLSGYTASARIDPEGESRGIPAGSAICIRKDNELYCFGAAC